MNHWMFRCQDVSQKMSQSMDEPLPLLQHLGIRLHLMMCRYCARCHSQLMTLRKLCRAEALPHLTKKHLNPFPRSQKGESKRSFGHCTDFPLSATDKSIIRHAYPRQIRDLGRGFND